MAFLGRCYGCRENNHEKHTKDFDSPPKDEAFICGGGICVCSECEPELGHLER